MMNLVRLSAGGVPRMLPISEDWSSEPAAWKILHRLRQPLLTAHTKGSSDRGDAQLRAVRNDNGLSEAGGNEGICERASQKSIGAFGQATRRVSGYRSPVLQSDCSWRLGFRFL